MYDKTQLMRGSLEGCILKIIEQHMTYGYEILMNMKEAGWIDVTEGTLYPILLRLEKLHYIRAEKKGFSTGTQTQILSDHNRRPRVSSGFLYGMEQAGKND